MKTPEKNYVTQNVPSFTVYYQDQRGRLSSKYPFLTADQISNKIRDQWKKMKNTERKSFTLPKLCLTPQRKSCSKKKLKQLKTKSEDRRKKETKMKLFTEIGTDKKVDLTSLPVQTSTVYKQISVADWLTRENYSKKKPMNCASLMSEVRKKMEVPVPDVLDRTPHLKAGILKNKDRSLSLEKQKQDGRTPGRVTFNSTNNLPEARKLSYNHDNAEEGLQDNSSDVAIVTEDVEDDDVVEREVYSDSDDDNLLHYRHDDETGDGTQESLTFSQQTDRHSDTQDEKIPTPEDKTKLVKPTFTVLSETTRVLRPRKKQVDNGGNVFSEKIPDQDHAGRFNNNNNKNNKTAPKINLNTENNNLKEKTSNINLNPVKNYSRKSLYKPTSSAESGNFFSECKTYSTVKGDNDTEVIEKKKKTGKSRKRRRTLPGLFDDYEIEMRSDEEEDLDAQDRLIEEFYQLSQESGSHGNNGAAICEESESDVIYDRGKTIDGVDNKVDDSEKRNKIENKKYQRRANNEKNSRISDDCKIKGGNRSHDTEDKCKGGNQTYDTDDDCKKRGGNQSDKTDTEKTNMNGLTDKTRRVLRERTGGKSKESIKGGKSPPVDAVTDRYRDRIVSMGTDDGSSVKTISDEGRGSENRGEKVKGQCRNMRSRKVKDKSEIKENKSRKKNENMKENRITRSSSSQYINKPLTNLNNNNNNLVNDEDDVKIDEMKSLHVGDYSSLYVRSSFSTSYGDEDDDEDEDEETTLVETKQSGNQTLEKILEKLKEIGSQSSQDLPVSDDSPKLLSPTLSGVSMLSSLSETESKPVEKPVTMETENETDQCSSRKKKKRSKISDMFEEISPQNKKQDITKKRRLTMSNKTASDSNFNILFQESNIFL